MKTPLPFMGEEGPVAQQWEVRVCNSEDNLRPILHTSTPPPVIPEFAKQMSGTQKAQQYQRAGWIPVLACGQTGKTNR